MKYLSSIGILIICQLVTINSIYAFELDTEIATRKSVSTTYMLDGVVEATHRTTISSQTAGIVKKIRYDVNDLVKKNEAIIVINNTQQKAALTQAKAELNEALANVNNATIAFNRAKEVYAKNAISKADLDKAETTLSSTNARYEAADARVTQAKEQLEYTVVKAPFSGIMTERLVEVGESVFPNKPLVSGLSLENLRINTYVPQSIIQAVRTHHRATIVTEDAEIISNKMTFFPYADVSSHAFQLRIELPKDQLKIQLPNEKSSLFPGMFVKVAMEVDRQLKTVIPFSAIAFRGEVTGVYVLENNSLNFRHVRLGKRLDTNEVVIISGIQEGEHVVVDPVAAAISIKDSQSL